VLVPTAGLGVGQRGLAAFGHAILMLAQTLDQASTARFDIGAELQDVVVTGLANDTAATAGRLGFRRAADETGNGQGGRGRDPNFHSVVPYPAPEHALSKMHPIVARVLHERRSLQCVGG